LGENVIWATWFGFSVTTSDWDVNKFRSSPIEDKMFSGKINKSMIKLQFVYLKNNRMTLGDKLNANY
jgi:hypothetical protein